MALNLELDPLAVASRPALRVEISDDRGAVLLALQGEADLATAPSLIEALERASTSGTAPVVLDAASLSFIDCYCLGLIASTRVLLREGSRELAVRSPSPFVRRLLSLLELEDLIEHG